MHWEMPDEHRHTFSQSLAWAPEEGCCLAGATALALLVGQREGVDFDFVRAGVYDTGWLFARITEVPGLRSIVKARGSQYVGRGG
jgi:hypothetical protein